MKRNSYEKYFKIGLDCYCCLQQYTKEKMQIGINNVEEKRMEIKDFGKY